MTPSLSPAVFPYVLRALGSVAVGALCFVLGVTGIRKALPFPDVPSLKPKYEWFAHRKESYDTLFIGSSRFYHQIIPKEFDALVEKATGHRTHSFNAAYDGMWPPESYFLLRKLLALKPGHLKWVFIDAMEIKADLGELNEPTIRQAWWHDWYHTQMAIRSRGESRYNQLRNGEAQDREHRVLMARFYTNLGRGAELVYKWLKVPDRVEKVPPWTETEGFNAEPGQSLAGADLQDFLEKSARMRKGMETYPPGPVFGQSMADIVRAVRSVGAEPIFVIAPTINEFENLSGAPEGAALYPFDSPAEFPVLFDPAMHFDAWHLNEEGAHLFTRYLAERFTRTSGAK